MTEAPPSCPVHSQAMKPGKGGGWFCSRKMPDGSWCSQRVAAAKPTPVAGAAPADEAARLGALESAARVYEGTGMADDVLAFAQRAFSWVKGG